ncbi:hypothetical protein FRB91_008552, partial [Serendipita sp. 411]
MEVRWAKCCVKFASMLALNYQLFYILDFPTTNKPYGPIGRLAFALFVCSACTSYWTRTRPNYIVSPLHLNMGINELVRSLRAPLLQSLVSTLDFLLQDSHILPKEELVVLSIGIVSSIGSIHDLDLLNFRSMSLVLDTLNMTYRKMKMERNYMMLSTLLDFAPLTPWLVSKAEVVSNLGVSRLISQLLSQWLEYHCAREDSWERRITPFLSEHSLAASNYLL